MEVIDKLLPTYFCAIIVLSAVSVRAVPPASPPLHDVAGSPLPAVIWTHSFNFDDGPQGWTIDPGNNPALPARWIDPSEEPNGPVLPDGQASGSSGIAGDAAGGSGGGSLYLPGDNAGGTSGNSPESIATRGLSDLIGVPGTKSFVMQVDVYVANLLPLGGFRHNGAYPGLHLESAGFCLVAEDNGNKAMCLEGAGTNTSSGSGSYNGYLRFRDFADSAGNNWQYPTCCGGKTIMDLEGVWMSCNNGPNSTWWDDWVTLYINYNYSKENEVYVWAYIPWPHPNPNCDIASPPQAGWIEITRRAIGSTGIPAQYWTKLQLGGAFSWTQGQWDNVKLCVHSPCHENPFDHDGDGDVDMDDFGAFQRCYTGPNPLPDVYNALDCRCFDRYPAGAPDDAIDQNDFSAFAACAGRSNVLPPAGCDN